MPVHRTDIADTQVLKKLSGYHKLFHTVLGPLELFSNLLTGYRNSHKGILNPYLQSVVSRTKPYLIQIFRHGAHIVRNGHLIVI